MVDLPDATRACLRVVPAVATGVDVSRVPDARTYFKTVENELENSGFGSAQRSWIEPHVR